MIITLRTHGLFLYAYNPQGPGMTMYAIKSVSAPHEVGLAIYKSRSQRPSRADLIKVLEGQSPPRRIDIVLSKPFDHMFSAPYAGPMTPESKPPPTNNWSWMLDLENEIYKTVLTPDSTSILSTINIQGGHWEVASITQTPVKIINAANQFHHILTRKIAATTRTTFALQGPDDYLSIRGFPDTPLLLSGAESGYATISLKNYEPKGAPLSDNHLHDLTHGVTLGSLFPVRFTKETERARFSDPDWIYENSRPPEDCTGGYLGRKAFMPIREQ